MTPIGRMGTGPGVLLDGRQLDALDRAAQRFTKAWAACSAAQAHLPPQQMTTLPANEELKSALADLVSEAGVVYSKFRGAR